MLRALQFEKSVAHVFSLLALLAACSPKVSVEAPKEPITINMNIKIEHEIRVKVDRELDQLLDENEELF